MMCFSVCVVTHRLPLYLLFLFISLVFLVVNLVCALLVRMSSTETHTVVLVRVAINDSLFVLCAISLSLCLYKIAKMSLANIYLESKVRDMSASREMLKETEREMAVKDVKQEMFHSNFVIGIRSALSAAYTVAPLCEDALLPIISVLYIVIVP